MIKLNNLLINKDKSCTPIWFMRQAGRYLPEFRNIRKNNKDFIKLCLNSKLSSEITLQPIRRYDLDAAIIFSDILMIPFALGQSVEFKKNFGPILSSFEINKFKKQNIKDFSRKLSPVYKAISKTRNKLEKSKSLICFVGAPWTLIVYMFALKKNGNKINFNKMLDKNLDIEFVLKKLIKYSIIHIDNQIKAGADTVQIFDSWAGLIPNNYLKKFCYKPNQEIVKHCKKKEIPVICFPKGINKNYVKFNNLVRPDGLSLDYKVNPTWAKNNLKNVCLQGGLDPKFLLKKDSHLIPAVIKYLKIFENFPYIFNLGHGVLPKTSPKTIKKVVNLVKSYNGNKK